MEKSDKIWMDGKLVDWDDAKIHILTNTFNYGLGVFEGIRCYNTAKGPAIFRLEEHLDRLYNSAKIASIKPNFSKDELRKALIKTIKVNKLKECYIKPIIYYGYGEIGLYPKNNPVNSAISVYPWGAYLGAEGLSNGISVKISSFSRHYINAAMTKAKICGFYANSQLAKMEAIENGYDEALLLDTEGRVAEGSGENLFIIKNRKLMTPPVLTVLDGITRDSAMQIARYKKYVVEEASLTRDMVYIADEAFFTGTAAELTPIREIDKRPIGIGRTGPVTKELQEEFFKAAKGKNKNFLHWLTFI